MINQANCKVGGSIAGPNWSRGLCRRDPVLDLRCAFAVPGAAPSRRLRRLGIIPQQNCAGSPSSTDLSRRGRRQRWQRAVGAVSFFVLWMSLLSVSTVYGQDCDYQSDHGLVYPNPTGENRFRVWNDTFQAYHGLSPLQTAHVVGLASREWNDNANSGYFTNMGSISQAEFIQEVGQFGDPGCNLSQPGMNYIYAMNTNGPCQGASAAAYPSNAFLCPDAGWLIVVCPVSGSGLSWSTAGVPSAQQRDMVSVMVHEFGHVLDLAHPASMNGGWNCPTASVMNTSVCDDYVDAGLAMRALFRYDIKCSSERGFRSVSVQNYSQWSTGFSGPATVAPSSAIKGQPFVTSFWPPQSARSLIRQHTGTPESTIVMVYPGLASGGSPSQLNALVAGALPGGGWWQESGLAHQIRTFTTRSTSTSWYANNTVRLYAHNIANISAGAQHIGNISRCSNPSTCSPVTIRAIGRVDSTFDYADESTIAVWANQARFNNSDNMRVVIGVRALTNDRLGHVAPLDIHSSVPPAVACQEAQAFGEKNCLLAYVRRDDPASFIRVRAFSVNFGGTGAYGAGLAWAMASGGQVAEYTVLDGGFAHGALALWYYDSAWWLAYGHPTSSDVIVRSSTNGGMSWTTSILGPSITSPVVSPGQVAGPRAIYLTQP